MIDQLIATAFITLLIGIALIKIGPDKPLDHLAYSSISVAIFLLSAIALPILCIIAIWQ